MVDGSGSVPLTNRSGSRRPKNIRIRIRNTAFYWYLTFRARVPIKLTQVAVLQFLKVFLSCWPDRLNRHWGQDFSRGLAAHLPHTDNRGGQLNRGAVDIAEHLCSTVHLKIVSESTRYDPNQTKIRELKREQFMEVQLLQALYYCISALTAYGGRYRQMVFPDYLLIPIMMEKLTPCVSLYQWPLNYYCSFLSAG